MTLTDFLLARIAEDEVTAREAITKRDSIAYVHPPVVPDLAFEAFEDIGVPAVIVGPERVLAECEAKLRIVGMYVGPTEDDEGNLSAIGGYGEAWLDAIRFLALPYADHPDYNPDWRP